MKLLNMGFGKLVSTNRIVAIVTPDSAPIKRLIQDARDNGHEVDATCGRKTGAVLIMDSGHIILSSTQPETMVQRANKDLDAIKNK